jgi:hypothetical protein
MIIWTIEMVEPRKRREKIEIGKVESRNRKTN